MVDYLQLHKDKKTELQDLNGRRDEDYRMVTSDVYKMLGADKKAVKDVVNVTMNRLKVFQAYVEASLNKADENVVVESEDEKIETSDIEDVIRAGFDSANHKLTKRGDFRLEPYFDHQACMRGEAAARVLFQMKTNKDGVSYLDPDITSWDSRYVTYDRGEERLAWGAYETKKTKATIESEAWAVKENFTIPGETAPVVEIWAPDENIIYVSGKKAFDQENPFGYVPICIQRVPIGTMLADEDSLKYQSESIFFLVRGLINEYNRCMSILQTLNLKATKAALQEAKEHGGEASSHDDVASMGSVTVVEKPGAIQMVPYGEARRSMLIALQEINKALDDGTLSRIMLGDLPGELSAVALVQIEKGQGQVFMPRLGTRGLEKTQIAEMFISQILMLPDSSFTLGVPGHKRTFEKSLLEGEYEITFRYSNKSPETDFARLSMAREYKAADMLDEKTIMKDIMKRDDPEGDYRRLHRQRLRSVVPPLKIYDGLMSLAQIYEDGDESARDEIEIAEAYLGVTLDNLMSGNIVGTEPEQETRQPVMPLIGERSSAQKAADLQATPEEEVDNA